jgi:hypothetical protein
MVNTCIASRRILFRITDDNNEENEEDNNEEDENSSGSKDEDSGDSRDEENEDAGDNDGDDDGSNAGDGGDGGGGELTYPRYLTNVQTKDKDRSFLSYMWEIIRINASTINC